MSTHDIAKKFSRPTKSQVDVEGAVDGRVVDEPFPSCIHLTRQEKGRPKKELHAAQTRRPLLQCLRQLSQRRGSPRKGRARMLHKIQCFRYAMPSLRLGGGEGLGRLSFFATHRLHPSSSPVLNSALHPSLPPFLLVLFKVSFSKLLHHTSTTKKWASARRVSRPLTSLAALSLLERDDDTYIFLFSSISLSGDEKHPVLATASLSSPTSQRLPPSSTALPTDCGPRLLKVDAHHDFQVCLQLLGERLQKTSCEPKRRKSEEMEGEQ